MKLLIALLSVIGAAQAVSFFDLVVGEFEAWKVQHGKNYTDYMEEKFRLKIYMENRAMIAKHNHKAHQGEKSYFMEMNHYGDLLSHEFRAKMNGFLPHLKDSNDGKSATFIPPAHVALPDEIDWRKLGAVTEVKNQGDCGSCWAFSATGSLEGQHFRKTGKLVSLSEQNLVDCSDNFNNQGCDGGIMDQAFKYVIANGGIDTEESYPYEARDEKCHFNPRTIGATDASLSDIKPGSEEDLKAAVATVGPVSVAIDAGQDSFRFYSHGVYDEPKCSPEELDHGVLVVGYGTENGQDYWLVKNSWSSKWGQNGYIKMLRNKNNQCGIASMASYPIE